MIPPYTPESQQAHNQDSEHDVQHAEETCCSSHDDADEEQEKEDDECCQQLEQFRTQLMNVTADFENFKRRSDKEKFQWISYGQKQLLMDLLTIVDDFDRALDEYAKKTHTQSRTEHDIWIKGFNLIHEALYKMLEKHQVREIKDIKKFDPALHEALVQIDSPEHQSEDVVAVLQKGFMFNDEVLRPAKVSVAK